MNANGIHAAEPGPSGLGIMQPKGRPQQGKLTMQNKRDTRRRDGPTRPGNDAALGGRSQLKMKLEGCHLMMLKMEGC